VDVAVLRRLGHHADAVADGLEMIKALEATPYDVVLTDVEMPDMDGLEATRIVRSDVSAVRDHNIPIVAMTAHALEGDRERCLEAGMDDYISKPINARELDAALRRVAGSDGNNQGHFPFICQHYPQDLAPPRHPERQRRISSPKQTKTCTPMLFRALCPFDYDCDPDPDRDWRRSLQIIRDKRRDGYSPRLLSSPLARLPWSGETLSAAF
jgi:CheY-like chemotaxis protein